MHLIINLLLLIILFAAGLIFNRLKPENPLGRTLAYLSGILMIITAGFIINIYIAYASNKSDILIPYIFVCTAVFSIVVFMCAIRKIKWKTALPIIAGLIFVVLIGTYFIR